MISSYEVGAVFRIIDEATPTLTKLSDKLGSLDKIVQSVNKIFGSFGKNSADGLIKGLNEADSKLKSIESVANKAGAALAKSFSAAETAINNTTDKNKLLQDALKTTGALPIGAELKNSFGIADAAIAGTIGQAKALEAQLKLAGQASNTIGNIGRIRPGATPGAGGGGGRTPGGNGPGGHSLEMHEQGKNYYGEQVEVGMNMGMLGSFGLAESSAAVKDTLEKAFKLIGVQQQMGQAGIGQPDIIKATAAAWAESAASGQDVVKVLEDIKELTFPLGNVAHAIEFAGPLEKMRVVLNAVTDGTGTASRNAVYEMARAGELKGLQTPEEFNSYFDQMTKVISATGGKITPKDFMQTMKYGRVASMGWDEEFVTRQLPSMMNALGPTGAGTAAMSLFGTLVQGKVSERSGAAMQDLGLIGDPSKIVQEKMGIKLSPGAVKGTDELIANPYKWVQDILKPLMVKKYGSLDSDVVGKDDADAHKLKVIEDLGGLFGNRMSAQAIAELMIRDKSIEKDISLLGTAKGIGGAETLLRENPDTVIEKVQSALGNLMTAIGGPGGKNAIEGLNGLASGINSITEVFNAHPEAGRLFLIAATALAAGFAALTTVGAIAALAFFLPGGEAVVGLTAIGSLLGSMALWHWDDLKIAGDAAFAFFDRLKETVQSALGWLPGMSGGNARKSDDGPHGRGLPHAAAPSHDYGLPSLDGMGMYSPMSYETTGGSTDSEDIIYRGVLRAFTDFANGKGATGNGGGFQDASYTTWGGGAAPDGGGIIQRLGRSKSGGATLGGNSIGSIGDGSAVDRALGMTGLREGQAAKALGHIMHAGEWCADFVNGTIAAAGGQGTTGKYAAMARSFMGWGHNVDLDKIMKGDVAVLNNGGHVGFFTGEKVGGRFGVVAGNTRDGHGGHAVEHYFVSPGSIYGARRGASSGSAPQAAPQAPQTQQIHIHLDGKQITASVVKRITTASRFPTSMGSVDNHSHYSNPAGTPIMDAA